MQVIRIDDIPLLYAQIEELGIQRIIDDQVLTHGNWSGISFGHLISLWMCYLLSESDHRLSSVEGWAEENLLLLGTLSEQSEIRSKDFTDDRLEQALDYISKKENWLSVSNQLSARSLTVYDLKKSKTVRLDSTPMQGHHKIKAGGLFQHGYRKGEVKEWIERRLFVLSTAYSLAQQKSLENRLTKMEERLKDLVNSKQGKRVITSKKVLEETVAVLLKEKKLSGLLSVKVEEVVETKKVRAYKERAAREEEIRKLSIEVSRNEGEIAQYKSTLGWQVYATSAEKEAMNFEQCVWKYRYQNRVERQFDNLRNKIVPLVPIFLKQENRVEALINVLMVCLKVCAVLEYKVAKQLYKNKEKLTNVYKGNPKRGTATPTAKRILGSFKGISLMVNNSVPKVLPPQIMITDLKEVQSKIIVLLGFQKDLYAALIDKMQLFFLNKKISES